MTTSVVYVDGACIDNAQAATGDFWNDNDEKNISEVVPVDQLQTNGYAELSAVIRAIETAVNVGLSEVTVKSDSRYVVSGGTKWIETWSTNNWIKSNGSCVKHQTLWKTFRVEEEDCSFSHTCKT